MEWACLVSALLLSETLQTMLSTGRREGEDEQNIIKLVDTFIQLGDLTWGKYGNHLVGMLHIIPQSPT